MAKRSFTADQKAAILQEADQQGVIATCRKHQISSSLFYQWHDKLTLKGKNGLEHGQTVLTQEVRRLVAENARLKSCWPRKNSCLISKKNRPAARS